MRIAGFHHPPIDQVSVARHSHRHAEWHFILSGSCRFEVGEREVAVASGDLLYIPARTAHRLCIGRRGSGVVQVILYSDPNDPRDADLMQALLSRSASTGVLRAGGDRLAAIQRLILDSSSDDPVQRYGADLGFTRLVCDLVGGLPPSSHPGVVRALALMRARLSGPIRLAELVAESGCGRSLFMRLFRAEVGEPPLAHLNSMRLKLAAELLRRQDRPICMIARAVGFDDPYHFSRSFRSRYGLPPSLWRRHPAGAIEEPPPHFYHDPRQDAEPRKALEPVLGRPAPRQRR